MTDLIRPRVKYVIGPDGSPLTIADLPPATMLEEVVGSGPYRFLPDEFGERSGAISAG